MTAQTLENYSELSTAVLTVRAAAYKGRVNRTAQRQAIMDELHGRALARQQETVAKFERILDAEFDLHGAKASVAFAPISLPMHLLDGRHEALAQAKRELSEAIDALTPAEGAAFPAYRAQAQQD